MTVGEFARHAGLRASAVRYCERLGLLPPPPRRSGRRVYGPEAFAHLALVRVARECGFTLEETRQLLRGFAECGERLRRHLYADATPENYRKPSTSKRSGPRKSGFESNT